MLKKKLKPSVRKILIAVLVLLVGIGSVLGYIGYKEYSYRFVAVVEKSGEFKVYPDMSFDDVAAKLEGDGYVASSKAMKRMATRHERDSVQIGNYYLSKGESYRTLLTRLFYGRQSPVKITFNNVRTLEQLSDIVGKKTLAGADEFLRYFNKQAKQTNGPNYISRFIPDTYEFYWTVTPAEFCEKMGENYDKFWASDSRMDKAQELGLTAQQVIVIASIVIEETKNRGEMSDVAGVYVNRLKKGMPLQADPTVKFAVGDFTLKRILNKHLNYDSPYNTYKNSGLPPGPICSPAIVAIDATLDYADAPHNYLYFCAAADFSGTHAFAATLSDHNANARAYHKELNRRKIR